MATLKSNDFTKPASGGPYAGQDRFKIFGLKIKDKRTFFIGDNERSGKEVVGISIDKTSKKFTYEIGKGRTAKQETVPITRVFKDKDFGGGAGSGGGAEDTKFTESMQCFYCAYVFNIKKGVCKSVSDADLKKASKWVHADATLAACMKNGPKDWIESDVYIKTANKLWAAYGKKMKGGVLFHRGSKFMTNVYKAKTATHKKDKTSKKPQAPGSFSHDKWNPGDIWASTFGPNDEPLKEHTDSWGELNATVHKLATQGKLLGISLKKIASTQASAKLVEFNSPKQRSKRESYTFKGYTYGKTGDFFSSQDIYLRTSEGDVQFRTFGGETSWQGEIKGGAAAGGKIGGGNVDFFTKQVLGDGIYTPFNDERTLLAWVRKNDSKAYRLKLWDLYKKHNKGSSKSKPLLSQKEFIEKLRDKDFKFKNSKIICLEFIDTLAKGNKKKKDEFTTKMFRYAQSNVDQSSYFVKLY